MIALWRLQLQKGIGLTNLLAFGVYFPALIEFENSKCRGLVAFSGVALTILEELKLNDRIGLNAMPDLSVFPRLEILNLKGLSTFTSSAGFTTL